MVLNEKLTSETAHLDADLALQCPVCGQNNQCGRVGASSKTSDIDLNSDTDLEHASEHDPKQDTNSLNCWCVDIAINMTVYQELADVRAKTRCICPQCAQASLEHGSRSFSDDALAK